MRVFLFFLFALTYALYEGETWITNEVDLGNGGDTIFYYLFKARNITNRGEKLIIWLNGGPGCSSNVGMLIENGPYMFDNKTFKLQRNNFSWNEDYDLVFVDQPVGTGYSNVKDSDHYCRNETCVAVNFYRFFIRFLEVYHFEYIGKPIYIFGESYAGHYIPAITEYILKANNPNIKLEGAAIGNGLTDMSIQFLGYADYLLENKLATPFSYIAYKLGTILCHISLDFRTIFSDIICMGSFYYFAKYAGIVNVYDITRDNTDDKMMDVVSEFMKDCEVQKIYGIKKCKKIEGLCDNTVYEYMIWDFCTSITSSLEYTLSKIKVLIYYGVNDYICNWIGGERLVNSLNWSGQKEFNKVSYTEYKKDNVIIGERRLYDKLSFVKVKGAGHLVPTDKGEASLLLLRDFIDYKPPNN